MTFIRFDNTRTALDAMDGFFRILLDDVVAFSSVADSVIFALLACNILALGLLSFFVLRSVRTVLPTCQHRTITARLMYSLPVTALSRAHRLYASCERGMETLNDEAAAKAGIEGMDDADEAGAIGSNAIKAPIQQQNPVPRSGKGTKFYDALHIKGCAPGGKTVKRKTPVSDVSEPSVKSSNLRSTSCNEKRLLPVTVTQRRISFECTSWASFDENSAQSFSSSDGSKHGGIRHTGSQSTQRSGAPDLSPGTPAGTAIRNLKDSTPALLALTTCNVMRCCSTS
jgi:hypothetical protein